MNKLVFSQEHLTLPLAELRAVLESCYPDKKITLEFLENSVKLVGLGDASLLKNRLAYAMEIDGKEVEQGFDSRYSRNRPFSHPTTLDPKLARCMVNLARPEKTDAIFDPFCGTGGILLEAGLMGLKTIGIDIDVKMVEGCRKNLEHFGVKDYSVSVGDFFKTKKRGVIVTDPPYGKSTSLPGKTIEGFYNLILEQLQSIMKPGEFACIGSPSTLNITEQARNMGVTVQEEHLFYVNKDLSKRILVLKL